MPEHWDDTSVKHCYEIQLGKMLQPEPASPKDSEISYLKALNVQWGKVVIAEPSIMWASEHDVKQFGVRRGDLLVCEGGEAGRAALFEETFEGLIIQNALHRVRAKLHGHNGFLLYWLVALASSGWFEVNTNKATIAHFTKEKFGALPLYLPPLAEQRAIAEFLDRETARVDALVEKKQQLIERLREYRTALITQTVTKGLPPDVAAVEGFNPASSFKPSGVEWLGDVPEHWEVKRLGDIADLVSGYPFDSVYFDRNEGFPLIRMGDLYRDETEMNWSGQLISEALVDTGDILVGISGEFNVSMWSHGPALLNQRICCIRSHYRIVNQRLIYYCLLIQLMLVNDTIYSTTIKNLSLSELRKLSIPVPPIQEQRVIAEFLDRETERIDALSARVETAIERLQEYRTALITAAVTRKIDVQGFVGVETADIGTVAK
ncbi:MAG: restriction endonuclease subunit S [bacterium]|nr:restriction endonuclease subunit S [bacterium]